jgi:hypothetical protein
MTKSQFIEDVKAMDVPARAKAELLMIWCRAQKVAEGIVRFAQRHRHFAESLLLGAIMAYLVSFIPWLGGLAALCALVTSAAIGVLKELREDIASLFEPMTIEA